MRDTNLILKNIPKFITVQQKAAFACTPEKWSFFGVGARKGLLRSEGAIEQDECALRKLSFGGWVVLQLNFKLDQSTGWNVPPHRKEN